MSRLGHYPVIAQQYGWRSSILLTNLGEPNGTRESNGRAEVSAELAHPKVRSHSMH